MASNHCCCNPKEPPPPKLSAEKNQVEISFSQCAGRNACALRDVGAGAEMDGLVEPGFVGQDLRSSESYATVLAWHMSSDCLPFPVDCAASI